MNDYHSHETTYTYTDTVGDCPKRASRRARRDCPWPALTTPSSKTWDGTKRFAGATLFWEKERFPRTPFVENQIWFSLGSARRRFIDPLPKLEAAPRTSPKSFVRKGGENRVFSKKGFSGRRPGQHGARVRSPRDLCELPFRHSQLDWESSSRNGWLPGTPGGDRIPAFGPVDLGSCSFFTYGQRLGAWRARRIRCRIVSTKEAPKSRMMRP